MQHEKGYVRRRNYILKGTGKLCALIFYWKVPIQEQCLRKYRKREAGGWRRPIKSIRCTNESNISFLACLQDCMHAYRNSLNDCRDKQCRLTLYIFFLSLSLRRRCSSQSIVQGLTCDRSQCKMLKNQKNKKKQELNSISVENLIESSYQQ